MLGRFLIQRRSLNAYVSTMSKDIEIRRLEARQAGFHETSQSEDGPTATSATWSHHMPLIKRLYIDDNYSLDQVMEIMARDYDFYAGYGAGNIPHTQMAGWSCNGAEICTFAGKSHTKRN